MKYLLILLFSVLAFGSGVTVDYVRLTPSTLPATCNSGDLRVSPSPNFLLQICRTNTWYDTGFQNPMTTNGDLITQTAGVPARIPVGTANYVLKSSGTAWAASLIANSSIDPAAAIDFSKMATLATGIVPVTNGSGVLIASSTTTSNLSSLDTTTSLTTQLAGKQATGNYVTALTGDVTATGPGSVAATLATVNTNTGSWGTATQAPQFTVNGKGLITAAANVTVTPAVGSITGLGTGVATFLGTPSSANLISAVTDETGTGALVFGTSPAFTTPNLGTPSALVLTNATGTPTSIGLANGTGLPISTGVSGLGSGVSSFLGTPSSANLITAVTDETGTGALVFGTSPAFTTPNLGTPSALVLTNATGTPTSIGLANGTGLPVSTGISGLGSGVATFLATPSSANLISAVTDETGTGALVFGTSPAFTTPNLGTPSALVLTNATGTPTSIGLANGSGLPVSTGISGLGTGVATFLATPSTANLAAAVTGETGTGAVVFGTSPTLTTPNEDVVTYDGQGSTPSTPSAGFYKLYFKDATGKLTTLNPAGVEQSVGSGSGAINYLASTDIDGESNTVGNWAAYLDAVQATPTDGTGGSPNTTVAVSADTTLRGSYNYLITKGAANRQGEGVAVPFTLDSADKSKVVTISWDYIASANYTGSSGSEYMVAYVYDVTNSVLIPTSNIVMPQGTGSQQITFNATTSTSYRLIFHIAGTGASAWTYRFDTVTVGPRESVIASALSDWGPCTVTGTWVSNTTYTAVCKRVGDTLQMQVKVLVQGGAPTATSLVITMPTGYTIDTTKMAQSGNTDMVAGWGTVVDSGSSRVYASANVVTSTTLSLNYPDDAVGGLTVNGITQAAPFTFGSADYVNSYIEVPIVEWSSNIQLANSRVEYACNSGMTDAADTTSFSYGTAGCLVPQVTYTSTRSKTVRFKNPIQASDTFEFQVSLDSGRSWFPVVGMMTPNTGGDFTSFIYQNAVTYGLGRFIQVASSSTDVIASFGQYAFPAGAYAAAGTGWGVSPATTSYWRLAKFSNAVPVESAVPDYKEAVLTVNTSTVSAGVEVDVTGASLTLDPGTWDIGFEGTIEGTTANGWPVIGNVQLTDSSNNVVNNAIRGFDLHTATDLSGDLVGTAISVSALSVNVAAQTTYKTRILNIRGSGDSVTTVTGDGTISTATAKSKMWARKVLVGSGNTKSVPVSAIYTGRATGTLNGSFNTTTYPTKIVDTHNAYSAGTYTVPISGFYNISAETNISGTFANDSQSIMALFVNGVEVTENYETATSSTTQHTPKYTIMGYPLNAGDLVTIRNSTAATGSPAYVNSPSRFHFSISKAGP